MTEKLYGDPEQLSLPDCIEEYTFITLTGKEIKISKDKVGTIIPFDNPYTSSGDVKKYVAIIYVDDTYPRCTDMIFDINEIYFWNERIEIVEYKGSVNGCV